MTKIKKKAPTVAVKFKKKSTPTTTPTTIKPRTPAKKKIGRPPLKKKKSPVVAKKPKKVIKKPAPVVKKKPAPKLLPKLLPKLSPPAPPTPVRKKKLIAPPPPVHPSECKITKKRQRRTRGGPGRIYFDEGTENAIVTYNNLPDWAVDERNKVFNEKIKYPFEKLVENVFNTFKFSYFETSPLDVQKEAVSHLAANMHKFDKKKGKAFAYFSIVAKHFLIFLNNTNYKRFNQNVDISEERDENTIQLQSTDKHPKEVEMKEFMKLMMDFWETNVNKIFTKPKDLDIANAIIELFRNSERIDSCNKKALYLYIREISSCKTSAITRVINLMKKHQKVISQNYFDHGHIAT
jgi:hypothetical protein